MKGATFTYAALIALTAAGAAMQPGPDAASSNKSSAPAPMHAGQLRDEPPSILRATVRRVSADGRTIVLDGRDAEVPLPRGRVFVFDADRPIARGTIVVTRDRTIGAGVEWFARAPAATASQPSLRPGMEAVIVPVDIRRRLRERWPEGVPFAISVQSISESGRTAWLGAGNDVGLQPGDTLLAEHAGWPVARLELFRVEASVALASVTLLVANGEVAPGDEARLWPVPRDRNSGRTHSRVLRVVPRGTDRDVWIPAASPETAKVGDRWTLQRRGEYVGMAEVQQVTERFVIATAFAAFCRSPIELGDEAVRRPSEDVAAGRTPMHIFRVEGNECLVSGGQRDGLSRDMDLTVVRGGEPVSHLKVTTLNLDHVGARIDTPSAAPADRSPRVWDEVYVSPVRAPQCMRGRVSGVEWDAGVVQLEFAPGQSGPQCGQIAVVQSAARVWPAIALGVRESTWFAAPVSGEIPDEAGAGDPVWVDATGAGNN